MGFVIGLFIGAIIGAVSTFFGLMFYAKRGIKNSSKEEYMRYIERGVDAIGGEFKDDPKTNAMDAWEEYRKTE